MFSLKQSPGISKTELNQAIDQVRERVEPTLPELVYLVGSYSSGNAHAGSDLDIVLVYKDLSSIRKARELIHHGWNKPISSLPVDFIYFTKETFERKSTLGGLAFESINHGVQLYPGTWSIE